MSDCLRGECGLCAVTVLDADGELDHRDVFLSEDEQEEGGALCSLRLPRGRRDRDDRHRLPRGGHSRRRMSDSPPPTASVISTPIGTYHGKASVSPSIFTSSTT